MSARCTIGGAIFCVGGGGGCGGGKAPGGGAPMCRDCPARRAGDLAALAVAPTAPKGFAFRRPRHTLKGRQDKAAVAASRERLAGLRAHATAGGGEFGVLD